jgi:ABC-2 type transport system ATP-binding protein
MTAAISTNGLTKRFRDVAALTDLSLEVPAGSVFGFLGPNGAGKTTALKILAGLTRSTSGDASVNGVPVSVQGAHRAQVGYLAQEPHFYGWMSGRETLNYVASFFPAAADPASTDDVLELVGLADAADRPTRTYSGGMRQRLGIGQALAGNPSVLLLDEPAAALDPIGRRDVLELMQRLRGEKTIFYSTHILDDVQRVSDHVAILDRGRLVVSAPTAQVMDVSVAATVRVALRGAAESTATALAVLPGVASVSAAGRSEDEWHYDVIVEEGQMADVQRAVTRYAADAGLTLLGNRQQSINLEEAFLRIVDKERAA